MLKVRKCTTQSNQIKTCQKNHEIIKNSKKRVMNKDESSKEEVTDNKRPSSVHLDSTESSDFGPVISSSVEPNFPHLRTIRSEYFCNEKPCLRPRTATSGPSRYLEEQCPIVRPKTARSSCSNFEEPVLTSRSQKSVVREVLNSVVENACHRPSTSNEAQLPYESRLELLSDSTEEVFATQHVAVSEPNMRNIAREQGSLRIVGPGLINSTSAMHDETVISRVTRCGQSFTRIPPSYSTVLKLGPSTVGRIPQLPSTMSSFPFIPRQPPPSYAEVHLGGDWGENPSAVSSESFSLGPNPIYAACPRCRTIVRTDIHRERSHLSHVMSIFLCICFCWPCCLLPYCLKSCQNTYHFCPTCHYYMGVYRPC